MAPSWRWICSRFAPARRHPSARALDVANCSAWTHQNEQVVSDTAGTLPAKVRVHFMSYYRGVFVAGGLLALLMACTPSAPAVPTAPAIQATVQSAGTSVSGAVGAAATAVQTGVVQPTVGAARTEVVATAQGAATSVAPTVSAARTEVAPTVGAAQTAVGAVQTQVAPAAGAVGAVGAAAAAAQARQAAATEVAPTAQAVATHVAPTVQAAATQAVGAVGTSVATSPVRVNNVKVDSADTTVAVQNSGSSAMNLRGYTLLMGPNFSVMLGDIAIEPGQTRTIHLSQGTDTPNDVYLGFGSNVAAGNLTSGTRVVLVAPADTIASVFPIS
jgi:hypothetical protein